MCVLCVFQNLSLSDSIEGSLKEAKPVVEQYGDYRWYAGLGISYSNSNDMCVFCVCFRT